MTALDRHPARDRSRRAWRRRLGALELLVAVNALAGAVYGLCGADGVPRDWLEGSPFGSYVVPSLILLLAVGGSMTLAAVAVQCPAAR